MSESDAQETGVTFVETEEATIEQAQSMDAKAVASRSLVPSLLSQEELDARQEAISETRRTGGPVLEEEETKGVGELPDVPPTDVAELTAEE